jgi:hypothetical protein
MNTAGSQTSYDTKTTAILLLSDVGIICELSPKHAHIELLLAPDIYIDLTSSSLPLHDHFDFSLHSKGESQNRMVLFGVLKNVAITHYC